MVCTVLFQQQNDIVPAPLAQLGVAVVVLFLTFKIIQEIRQMLSGGPKKSEHDGDGQHDSRTEYRLNKLDEEMKERITRTEYESRNADTLRALNRMEGKLDQLVGIRKLFTGKEEQT